MGICVLTGSPGESDVCSRMTTTALSMGVTLRNVLEGTQVFRSD